MKKFWHPLKLAAVLYILADISFVAGGFGYDNWLLTFCGLCGMLGNFSLLVGGSGATFIRSDWLRRVAPYAERISMALYLLQGLSFALSCAIFYNEVIWSGIIGVAIGSSGNLVGIFMKAGRPGLQPYQITGALFLVASVLGLLAGVESINTGVIVAHCALVFGSVCVILSHRAEFNTRFKHGDR